MDLSLMTGIFAGLCVALAVAVSLKWTIRPTKANRYIARKLRERGL